jgi:hypothetical protein
VRPQPYGDKSQEDDRPRIGEQQRQSGEACQRFGLLGRGEGSEFGTQLLHSLGGLGGVKILSLEEVGLGLGILKLGLLSSGEVGSYPSRSLRPFPICPFDFASVPTLTPRSASSNNTLMAFQSTQSALVKRDEDFEGTLAQTDGG